MRTRRLSYGRGAGPYIRVRSGAAKTTRRVCEARGQIRVGPDHGPEPRVLRLCPRLGEVRVEGPVAVGARMGGGPMCPQAMPSSTESLIAHDPGQTRVQGSGLRKGPAGGPGSIRSI